MYRKLEKSDWSALELFCKKCKAEDLKNNSSLETLKISEIQPPYGQYWIVQDSANGDVVGIAGCHQLPEVSPQAYRILYRSCMLSSHRIYGTKNLFKNYAAHEPTFKNIVPLQIEWAKELGGREFYISTNTQKDEPWKDKMVQANRVLILLEKQKIVSLFRANFELYHTRQNLWLLNEANFMKQLQEKVSG